MSLFTVVLFIILIMALLEAPLFTVIAGLALACFYLSDFDFQSIQMVLIEMNRLASMPVLVALPLFTFAGFLLTETSAPKRMMDFMQALLGWIPGGLAIAALCSCAFFTAITGASGVTIVALGGLLYPVLLQNKYEEPFTLGLLTTSGSLGLLFAPSLPIILYGVVAREDISNLFKAALIPGILLILTLSLYAMVHDRKVFRKRSGYGKPSWIDLKQTFMTGIWDWPMILILIAGVYGGFVTIAEVSAVVLTYIVVVECFILKEVNFVKQIPGIILESVKLSGAIILILAMSLAFTGYLVEEQIPNRILDFLRNMTENKYIFLGGLNLFLLAVGCMMDIFSAIVIIVPIMVPVAMTYGIDPIHLCMIFLVNLEIGYSTPPVGINLFISSLKFGKPVTLLYRSSLPYLALLLAALLMITYIPEISLFLVR
ncbi:MAG: TRAP transporter large permease subunit [Proteobacteria bacterium]|nr:TRAP transporter large permease subunit [Pseudomonadota bacterium]MBU4469819.1 TRAP transporter large permease subunit [Pseudomonadota bacterium]MCG2753054.1 TRAP transporter large permease subunit [Desulfobacteraceae bacterium]